MRAFTKWLAVAGAVGMFVVLIMGATVTNTGSAEGCGRSWPLCHGQFIPEFAVATMIEFSHRAVTGVEGFLVLGTSIGAWAFWRGHREVQLLVPVMLVTLVAQAGMGAWAVMSPQTPAVLATHFGISLLCLASTTLLATYLWQADALAAWRAQPVSAGYRRAVWLLTLFQLVVVYVGALVRHTNAQLACIDWPLCNGQLFPGFAGPVGAVFAHRLLALVSVVGLAWLLYRTARVRRERPDLYWGALAAFATVIFQSLIGAVVVWTRMELFAALGHAAGAALLFTALTYICMNAAPEAQLLATTRTRSAAT
jgi:cytochrome c oxidase assembly protein subunit 15